MTILAMDSCNIAFKYIKIELPEKANTKNRFKDALVQAFFALRKVNIKASM